MTSNHVLINKNDIKNDIKNKMIVMFINTIWSFKHMCNKNPHPNALFFKVTFFKKRKWLIWLEFEKMIKEGLKVGVIF